MRRIACASVLVLSLGGAACYPAAENNNLAESALGIALARRAVQPLIGAAATVQIGSLIWDRCAYGQTWDTELGQCLGDGTLGNFCNETDNDCNGGSDAGTLTLPYQSASGLTGVSGVLDYCESSNIGGITTWRVPTLAELRTLINCTAGPDQSAIVDNAACVVGSTPPTLDTSTFPGTPVSTGFFTASSISAGNAYIVNFLDGSIRTGVAKPQNRYVRCVADVQ